MSIRLDIDIRVKLSEFTDPDERLQFIERVMEAFREVFPGAEPIIQPDAPSPVTVTIQESELEEYVPDPNAEKIHIPTHEEILKGMEEDDASNAN